MGRKMQAVTSYNIIVGRILEQRRKEKNLEQSDVASHLDISQSAWSRIERGQTTISVEHLTEVCGLFGIEPHEVLRDADKAKKGLMSKGIQISSKPLSGKDVAAFLSLAALTAMIFMILRKK